MGPAPKAPPRAAAPQPVAPQGVKFIKLESTIGDDAIMELLMGDDYSHTDTDTSHDTEREEGGWVRFALIYILVLLVTTLALCFIYLLLIQDTYPRNMSVRVNNSASVTPLPATKGARAAWLTGPVSRTTRGKNAQARLAATDSDESDDAEDARGLREEGPPALKWGDNATARMVEEW